SPKYNEKTKEHVRMKKAIHSKEGTIFDFIICLPNNESEIAKSPLLIVLELEIRRYLSINNVITNTEFELVEELLQEASIKRYSLSYLSENFPNKFPLSHISSSHWDMNSGLYFDMTLKLDLAKYEIYLVELGEEAMKLINLIDRAVTKGFLAKPVVEINNEIIKLILWYVKNVICSKDERLDEYI
ncbi:3654_t:CDS:2, partial [Scutellospora calospora]